MIQWDVSPEFISLGPITVRWYGLLFASGFVIGYFIMQNIFKKEGKTEDDLNDLVLYMIVGTIIGARLGHCLFYNPEYYLSNPFEMIKIWKGGLASHGAAIGILTSLYFYVRKRKHIKYLWLMDRIVIPTALGGAFIRLGNLFNSEIIGKPADVAWSFVFTRVDSVPRHPTQIYESLAYLCVFVVLYLLYKKMDGKINHGYFLGLFLVLVFGFRFIVEFFKENQSYFEEGLALNMGQMLSIPAVLIGIFLMVRAAGKKNIPEKANKD